MASSFDLQKWWDSRYAKNGTHTDPNNMPNSVENKRRNNGSYKPDFNPDYSQYNPEMYDYSKVPIYTGNNYIFGKNISQLRDNDLYRNLTQFSLAKKGGWGASSTNPFYNPILPTLKQSYISSLLNPDFDSTASLVMDRSGGLADYFKTRLGSGGSAYIQSGQINRNGSIQNRDKKKLLKMESDQDNHLDLSRRFMEASQKARINGYAAPKKDTVTQSGQAFKDKYWGDTSNQEQLVKSDSLVPDKYVNTTKKKGFGTGKNKIVAPEPGNNTQLKWSA